MRLGVRLPLLIGLALVCLSPAAAAPIKTTGKAPDTHPVAAVSFPQEQSDLKADPDQIYGRLPNGMTYVIQKNTVPRGTAAIYMRVAAGSMMETDKQRGLAHFIEHMAFEGTTNIPAGELKRTLERHGFTFGADTNASTSESETLYKLNAPKADDETLDTALFIMREIAGNMTLDNGAIDHERGVVLSEERARDTPSLHYAAKLNSWLYPGQRFASNWSPIGSPAIIKAASHADLAAFYDSWYRPELTTLVVVGDFDPAQMESKIKTKFSDWAPRGPMPAEPDWGKHAATGLRTFSYTEKGLIEQMQIRWVSPPDDRPDSLQKRVDDQVDVQLFGILNRRYAAMVSNPDTAFLTAALQRSDHFRTDHAVFLAILPKPGRAKEAFEQAYKVFQTYRAYGVTPDEATILQSSLTTQEKAVSAGWKSRSDIAIVTTTLDGIAKGDVVLSLADRLHMYETVRPELSPAGMNARLKHLFDGDGPTLVHYGETLGGFDEAAIKADYLSMREQMPTTYAEAAKKAWPYTDFGPAATPVSHTVDKDFGFGHYVFANGVVLNIKTGGRGSQVVDVMVSLPGGRKKFDPAAHRPLFLAGGTGFVTGGLGRMTYVDMRNLLGDKRYSVTYAMGDDVTLLGGKTTATDLPTQMQVLMAYLTDPGLRPDQFKRDQIGIPEALETQKTDPAKILAYNLPSALQPGDSRFDPQILETIGQVDFADVRSVYADSLRDTPVIVTIVGDTDEAAAVAEVGKTFGTLPPRPATATCFPGADKTTFPPKDHEFTFVHEGRDDQSISMIAWPTTDLYASGRDGRGLTVLAAVIQNRLFDELRQKQGADYTPQAASTQSSAYRGFGYLQVRVKVAAGGDADFRATVAAIVADLKAHPISDDELLRIKKPMLDKIDLNRQNMAYIFTVLAALGVDERVRASELARRGDFNAITADDVMRLAQTYLKDDADIHIKVVPAAPAKPAP